MGDTTARASGQRVVAAANAAGRIRVFLERYEGWTGASNHTKIAPFSHGGQRRVLIGGFNLAEYAFDTQDHPNGEWYDTTVHVAGPAPDDIEAAVAMAVNDTPHSLPPAPGSVARADRWREPRRLHGEHQRRGSGALSRAVSSQATESGAADRRHPRC